MTSTLYHLGDIQDGFPDPNLALDNPDGLLAIGGCLGVERLKQAYKNGIFPWFSDGEPVLWWSPGQRAIIELDDFHISRSLKKWVKKNPVKVTINTAFDKVIHACRQQRLDQEGTWITQQMIDAYTAAHNAGIAHSVEIWRDDQLIGGLYGVMQSPVFCGESMFYNEPNASKLAMWALVNWLKRNHGAFIDCQLENPYLMSLGAIVLPRSQFLARLKNTNNPDWSARMWQKQELDDIYG